ncbi:unnamed protein product, partial [Symbiodinium necroappetens]
VVLLGSSALGIADKGSDIDVLACSAELTSSQYFTMARQELEGLEVQDLELAEDAVVPLLKFRAEGKEFEVQFSELRDEHLPLLRSSHAGGGEHGYERLCSRCFSSMALCHRWDFPRRWTPGSSSVRPLLPGA